MKKIKKFPIDKPIQMCYNDSRKEVQNMIIRTYKFKNGAVKQQRIESEQEGGKKDKIWKIGTLTEELWIPDALYLDMWKWKMEHSEN